MSYGTPEQLDNLFQIRSPITDTSQFKRRECWKWALLTYTKLKNMKGACICRERRMLSDGSLEAEDHYWVESDTMVYDVQHGIDLEGNLTWFYGIAKREDYYRHWNFVKGVGDVTKFMMDNYDAYYFNE